MTLVYCTSFDIYGPAPAPFFYNSFADQGWDFESQDWTILGDAVQGNPTVGTTNIVKSRGEYGIGTTPWGQRRGDFAFYADKVYMFRDGLGGTSYTVSGQESPRLTIPGVSQLERILHVAFSCDSLPSLELNHGMIFSFQDSFGQIKGYLGVNPSGRLVLYDGSQWTSNNVNDDVQFSPTVIAVSSTPVVVAETWVSLSIKIVTNAVNGNVDFTVYAGDIIGTNLVMSVTAGALTATIGDEVDILGLFPPSMAGYVGSADSPDTQIRYMRDLVICDNAGTYNNDLLGQVFVAAQEMRAEDPGGGWDAETRSNISDGVLNMQDANTGLRVADNALLELAAGDYTIEGFWRAHSLPIGTAEMTIASKWYASANQRSWRLYFDADGDELVFDISTDGTAITNLFRYPWFPDLDKYYHIAVSRDTAVTRIFVNGTQLGVDITDANTYDNGTGQVGLGSDWNSTTLVTTTAFDGFIDEFRLTVGLSRYSTDFTPTIVPFGRDVGGDANIANVELLMGFDGGAIIDESSNAFTVTVGAGVTADLPDDDDNSFQVLNRRPAWDDTYIEARNTFATSILTLTGLPLNDETTVLGVQTYTWKTTLTGAADEIFIGVDIPANLSNIIDAVNAGTGAGTTYGTGTVANPDIFASALPSPQGLFTATAIGTAGNSEPTTETLTNGSFNGVTCLGGEDIPSPSDFAMERLPVDVTGVLGMQITARGSKSDAGSAQLRFDLVGPSAGVGTGAALATDLSPSWLRQIFEVDPDTAATITPSTITGGRVRVTRTV
jgi:hypothetical protein